MPLNFELNGSTHLLDADPGMPLLWALRDLLGLTGTKYGCGRGLCGACTVHVDGVPQRACLMPLRDVAGRQVKTIEGLSTDGSHPLQEAWRVLQVPQCGYCQSGQIMSAAALLASHPKPGDAQIDLAMRGNLCRCGTYPRIRKAVKLAAELAANADGNTNAAVKLYEPANKGAQVVSGAD
jgi:isoquinoline 1-oxidoreductase subunit alpha